MYYLEDRLREDDRTCMCPNMLLQHKKGIVINRKGIHYDAVIDPNVTASPIACPKNETSSIFQSLLDHRLCSMQHALMESKK